MTLASCVSHTGQIVQLCRAILVCNCTFFAFASFNGFSSVITVAESSSPEARETVQREKCSAAGKHWPLKECHTQTRANTLPLFPVHRINADTNTDMRCLRDIIKSYDRSQTEEISKKLFKLFPFLTSCFGLIA